MAIGLLRRYTMKTFILMAYILTVNVKLLSYLQLKPIITALRTEKDQVTMPVNVIINVKY